MGKKVELRKVCANCAHLNLGNPVECNGRVYHSKPRQAEHERMLQNDEYRDRVKKCCVFKDGEK